MTPEHLSKPGIYTVSGHWHAWAYHYTRSLMALWLPRDPARAPVQTTHQGALTAYLTSITGETHGR